jgi:hypothetical protein
MTDVDGRTELLQRSFDDFNGAHDAGAETTGLGENYFHQNLRFISPVCVAAAGVPQRRRSNGRFPVM